MKIERDRDLPGPAALAVLRVETDDGVVGWGEPVVEGRAEVVRTAIEELAEYLIGQDPLRISDHWQMMTKGGFYRGGPILISAIAGIDQALWDIKGKALGAAGARTARRPGARPHAGVRLGRRRRSGRDRRRGRRAGGGRLHRGQDERQRPDSQPIDQPRPRSTAVVDASAAVREAFGDDLDFGVDFHGRVGAGRWRRVLHAIGALQPLFVEEPVLPEHVTHLLPTGRRARPIPLATGRAPLLAAATSGASLTAGVAVVQPDLSHAGGITEVRRIAALAEAYDVTLAPHCPLGPIALAACLQVDVRDAATS